MPTERLIVEVSEKGALVVKRNIADIGKGAQKAESAVQLLRRALGLIASAVLIRQYFRLADAFTNIQNRLRTVTTGTQELGQATDELFEIANRTRSSFEGTAEVYARVGLAAKDLGVEQAQLLSFTESLNQAVILSGASAVEAQAGLIQLSQGLASGALRGDELRSVLEQLPVVADVIAKELGVTRGRLREMGQEGKITADIVLNAFANARQELSDRFGQSVPTVSQAFQVLRNNLVGMIGEIDRSSGASRKLSQAVIFLANNLDTLLTVTKALVITFGILFAPQILAQAALGIRTLAKSITSLTASLNVLNASTIPSAVGGVKRLTVAFRSLWRVVAANPLIALGSVVIGSAVAGIDILNQKMDEAEAAQDRAHAKALQLIRARLREVQAVKAQNEGFEDFIQKLTRETELMALSETKRKERIALEKAEEAAMRPLTEAEEKRVKNLLIEQQAIEKAQMAEQERLEVLNEIKGPMIEFERKQAILNDLLKAGDINQQEYNKHLKEMKEAMGEVVQEDTFGQLIENLEFENSLLRMTNAERERALDIRQAEIALGEQLTPQQKEQVEQLVRQRQELTALNDQEQRKAQLLAEIIGPEQQFVEDQRLLKELYMEGAINLEQYNRHLKELKDELSGQTEEAGALGEILTSVWDNASNSLTSFIQSGKKGFTELADSILADIARIAAQRAFAALASGPLGGLFPGFQHGGSFTVGGQGGPDSQVVAFRATPGEEVNVLTRNQQQMATQAVPSVQPPPINIINVLDPSIVAEFMASTEGEQAVINVIGRNKQSVRQTLA